MSILSIKNLGKSYRSYSSEWKRIARWFGLTAQGVDEHWVLRHINFDIQPGEAIGVVGQNGAGKSTLLKMITGVLEPSEGEVQVNGRIAAILELGMGFNPDLTGRQNVIHSAGLMGYSHEQIFRALPEIEKFAEIGDYFDAPVRTYSSGMQVRVAFSVATAFRPDILIVDEALSVGDSYFQVKCINRIKKFLEEGTTLFLVSHDVGAIKTLCQRALLVDAGRIILDADALSVIKLHQSLMLKKENDTNQSSRIKKNTRNISQAEKLTDDLQVSGDVLVVKEAIEAVDIRFLDESNRPISYVVSGQPLTVEISVKFKKQFHDPHIGFGIRDKNGLVIYETNTYCMNKELGAVQKNDRVSVSYSFDCHLGAGDFSFVVGVANEGYGKGSFRDNLYYDHEFKVLKVLQTGDDIWAGFFNLCPKLKINIANS
ncbi:sugar ABC transporter ATP-binding protein [Terasakiella brassicae]|uniref:Sugar ABC transporter ATP-binding protein n=1 Tax=Terasakiella brassicae TaxID=1634917 RepID=A0A917FF36_9PROT|nr:ABC transporter ATP-binding protein [Terasakiella brassicae]GGF75144.1 sugar ABC transporter ATP-binding protein [Terasakiella brassicae]